MRSDTSTTVTASVQSEGGAVRALLEDRRIDSIELFASLPATQQGKLAEDAWTIGLRAIANAYCLAREARLEDVGASMIADMTTQVSQQLGEHARTMEMGLRRFFDPRDGDFVKRLDSFVADDGALARALRGHVGLEGSTLARTLAKQVGEESELFRKLSPTDAEGITHVLAARLEDVMNSNTRELQQTLDPHAENGAMARLMKALRDELMKADGDRSVQLESITHTLDANQPNSPLSRLIRETSEAQKTLLRAINPDDAESPIAAVKTAVEALLAEHRKSTEATLSDYQKQQAALDKLVREAVTRFDTRKKADDTSPRGGAGFEEEVVGLLERATHGGPYAVRPVGNLRGRNGKIGDALVEVLGEHAFEGCRVVVEAKRDASYHVAKALDEIQKARENRDASVGLFVMARSHARDGFPEFARYGNNILVVWDHEDPSTDPYLRAAVFASLAMVTRRRNDAEEGDLKALRHVEERIVNELKRVTRIRAANERISKSSDEIREELRTGERKLELLLAKAKDTLVALNVELTDEAAELTSPVGSPVRVGGASLRAGEGTCSG